MPQRPVSHQLEDVSINRFENLLPTTWVVRRKFQDYGVDLEVEIFTPKGTSTGLIFNVQIRATDDPKKEKKLQITNEQYDYFDSLPAPTIIVRYFRPNDSFYWCWNLHVEHLVRGKRAGKSFTISFTENNRWLPDTPTKIAKTVEILRTLQNYPKSGMIFLRVECVGLSPHDAFTVNNCVGALSVISGGLIEVSLSGEESLIMDVIAATDHITVALDCFHSLTFVLDEYESKEILADLAYAIAVIARDRGLLFQADSLARAILSNGIEHHDRFVAAHTATAITTNAKQSARLAVLNSIQKEHDPAYARFINHLLVTPFDSEERAEAVQLFYDAAMPVGDDETSVWRRGTVFYSLANFLFRQGQLAEAVQHYIRALRLRPAYKKTDYFLRELGECLFRAHKYRCATVLLHSAKKLGADFRLEISLGDALLLTGRVQEAERAFRRAAQKSPDDISFGEIVLKRSLCDWLINTYGKKLLPTNTYNGRAQVNSEELTPQGYRKILTDVDAFNPTANFKVGVHAVEIGDVDASLGHFVICALLHPNIYESWVNAIKSALAGRHPSITIAVFLTMLSIADDSMYAQVRPHLLVNFDDSAICELDELFKKYYHELRQLRKTHFVLRALTEHSFDLLVPAKS